jgi:hypothetical protein
MRLTLALALLAVIPAQPADQKKVLLFIHQTHISRPYIAKRVLKSCPGVKITLDQKQAQFVLDHDWGAHGFNHAFALYDQAGELIMTKSTMLSQNGIKDLCAVMESAAH